MSQYTKGPWQVLLDVRDIDSARIFAGSKYLGIVGNSDDTHEQTYSNARLIAAAPELLEALESVINDWLKRADCVLPKETCEKVIIAIAKAKGE